MDNKLLQILIEKGHIIIGTEIDANHDSHGLGGSRTRVIGNFTITSIGINRKDEIVLKCMNSYSGEYFNIKALDIINIDGMTPERLAENFMISVDGSNIKLAGKRRGRRPKNYIEEEYEM